MSNEYRIFGAEMSPYSVKIRSYFRYKKIPHQWLQRFQNEEEFKKLARLPLMPLVITPDGKSIQDTTPVIEKMEQIFPEPSVHPEDPTLAFLSALIEEYGDEWGMKLMFHHRWVSEADKLATSHILAREILPYADRATVDDLAKKVLARMDERLALVGSSAETAPLISGYLDRLLEILEPHLENRLYLFGDRPAFADFGLGLQVYEMALDPTVGAIIRARMPNILEWVYRMTAPRNDGPFEDWQSLRPTLEPLLSNAGTYFLPWSTANARALSAKEETFSVELNGETYVQSAQRYHAKSLNVLRERYTAVADKPALDLILEETGCLTYLQ
ncbi:MAG: glutathione S-transferase family protein [Rhodospirillales bacterium]|jgi:glutathione S-transferase|nr:enoyl-CoA hydratase [Acidiferrobacteraceae bacterium]MDP6428689.1 glutathione S-transferase family protein [Rhodospirillales bacterium]MDP6645112.1 glutathione S-transferase family protein [Rhodospirillales bacterium]MDP6843672.1 glutathione S-transferase family protein [Rhodospirillales bacterium]|tara:strand:+ start:410 stop:1399 length:990 start_codon:yes stop_codon:yes gene_type:complete